MILRFYFSYLDFIEFIKFIYIFWEISFYEKYFLYFWFIHLYYKWLQTVPVMSRRSLSKEELEVHEACFGSESGSNHSEPATPNPGQRITPSEMSILNTGSIDTLSQMIAKSLLDALNPSVQTVPTPVAMSRKRPHSLFDNLPLPTGRPSDANNASPIQFGVDANPPPPGAEDRNGPDIIATENPAVDQLSAELSNVSVSDPTVPDPTVPNPTVPNPITTVIAPDNSLPMSGLESPNFFPDPAVMAWAKLMIDSSEWSVEDRKSLMKEFIPEKELEHFFYSGSYATTNKRCYAT